MPDREMVIKAIEACMDHDHPAHCNECYLDGPGFGIVCRGMLMRDALALLKEQDEERKRLISWMGKFCAHVDTDFQPMPDEENTRFFREKTRTQFGWEGSA